MTLKLLQKLPDVSNVAANTTASIKCPVGVTYHELILVFGGTTALSKLTDIRVLANGKVIHQMSGTHRDVINRFDGREAYGSTQTLIIPFVRYMLKSQAENELTALSTGGEISNLSVEVDITSATNPTLTAYAVVSNNPPGQKGAGWILHQRRFAKAGASGAGLYEVSDLPRGGAEFQLLNRAFFYSTAALDPLEIQRDWNKVWEATAAVNTRVQLDGIRTPIATYIAYDPSCEGYGAEPLDLVNASDLRFKLTFDGAAALDVIAEYIGKVGN